MKSEHEVSILLVDDRPENLVALDSVLGELGYDLVKAHSGREALKYLLHRDFAVILLDVQMPEMDGFEAARLIRERERSRHTPIIFLTALGVDPEYQAKGYALGAVDYLAKPFDPEVLKAKVTALVDLALKGQAEARRYEVHHTAVLEAALDAIISMDQDGMVVEWNPAAEHIFGFSREETLGRELAGLIIPPSLRKRHRKGLERFRSTGVGTILGKRLELTAVRADGSEFPVELTISRIPTDGPALFLGFARDISGRKAAEAEIQERARQQAVVARLGQQALVTTDLSSLLDETVQAVAQTLAVGQASLLELLPEEPALVVRAGHGWSEGTAVDLKFPTGTGSMAGYSLMLGEPLIVTDLRAETRFEVTQTLLNHRIVSAASVVVPGKERAFGVLAAYSDQPRAFSEDDLDFLQAVANVLAAAIERSRLDGELRWQADMLRHQAEELADADRRKDAFLLMLAHELRNPVGAISNAVHVLDRFGSQEERAVRIRTTIGRQTRHLARLVDDLLDVSRIVRGRVDLHRERLDLAALTRNTAEDHRELVEDAGLRLLLEVPDQPVPVCADGTRICQVLANLIQNSAKYTPPGGEMSIRLQIEEDGLATVCVRDTGMGIEPELLPYIFEPFTQADRSLDRSQGGLGLGLALVRGLVEQHGGEVRVHSDGPGTGTEIAFRLPLLSGSAQDAPPTPAAAASERSLRVLIIEDQRDAAETLQELLDLFGHTAEIAHSGPEGVKAAERLAPDVVLCDIGLPGMDGHAVARELRGKPGTASTPMIAVTGYGSSEDRRRSEEAGFNAHLTKPVDPEELRSLLASTTPA